MCNSIYSNIFYCAIYDKNLWLFRYNWIKQSSYRHNLFIHIRRFDFIYYCAKKVKFVFWIQDLNYQIVYSIKSQKHPVWVLVGSARCGCYLSSARNCCINLSKAASSTGSSVSSIGGSERAVTNSSASPCRSPSSIEMSILSNLWKTSNALATSTLLMNARGSTLPVSHALFSALLMLLLRMGHLRMRMSTAVCMKMSTQARYSSFVMRDLLLVV